MIEAGMSQNPGSFLKTYKPTSSVDLTRRRDNFREQRATSTGLRNLRDRRGVTVALSNLDNIGGVEGAHLDAARLLGF